MKYYIHTFGCQMNERDSECIAGMMAAAGATPSLSMEESDIIIINTCAVRKKSEEKLFSLLGRLERLKKKKNIRIGVVGCVAQLYQSKIWDKRPFIDFILGPDSYRKIPKAILIAPGEKAIATQWMQEWYEPSPNQGIRRSMSSGYITVMEGCNNFCSYCIVPFTRGREKFRPMKNILQEAKELGQKGYKEIILLGQNVNVYRDPHTGKGLSTLLHEVSLTEGIGWIRFITSHPRNFTEDIARAMQENEKVCHQLHLPVQSGSTTVLQRMNRRYTRKEYLEKIFILRELMPDISLSTDIIVGYPGETPQEYEETLHLLEMVCFSNIFSFRYSPRPFTSASKEKDSVPFEEKKKRLIEIQAVQKEIQWELNRSYINCTISVLCDGISKKDPEVYSGRSEGHHVVNFSCSKNVIGQFIPVKILSCGPHNLIGEAVV